MITLIMGGRRAGIIPITYSPDAINSFSDIEQVRVVDILRHTYVSCTITPTISSLGVRVVGLGHISNSPIATNIIA